MIAGFRRAGTLLLLLGMLGPASGPRAQGPQLPSGPAPTEGGGSAPPPGGGVPSLPGPVEGTPGGQAPGSGPVTVPPPSPSPGDSASPAPRRPERTEAAETDQKALSDTLKPAAEGVDSLFDWEAAVVGISAARRRFDYYQPWNRQVENVFKTGVVLPGNLVLTTAERLDGATLVRLLKRGRGEWQDARIVWMDPVANIALIGAEAAFFADLKGALLDPGPARGAGRPLPGKPLRGEASIRRWSDGRLEDWRAEIRKHVVRAGDNGPVRHLTLQLVTTAKSCGFGEAVVKDGKLAGIVTDQTGDLLHVLPAFLISDWLKQRSGNSAPRPLSRFGITFQSSQNPATAALLGRDRRGRKAADREGEGIIVTGLTDPDPKAPPKERLLRPRDLLLAVDGHPIDMYGEYRDPVFGYISFEGLSTRSPEKGARYAGDKVRIRLLRDGKTMEIDYPLPAADAEKALVPDAAYGREPEYLLRGGLLFQTLNNPYLQSWGEKWQDAAPFRLFYYNNEDRRKDRERIVFLSQVLPDPYNMGYQEYRFLVLSRVNGRIISRLTDVAEALKKPEGDFHRFEFVPGSAVRRLVLAAKGMEEATQRVMQSYSIPKASSLGD